MIARVSLATLLALSAACFAGDGHRALIQGSGGVTVVFEAGLGDTLEVWKRVQPAVAGCARTFSYNRAGYPGSPRASGDRVPRTIAAELRAELTARRLPPPYLLVGHSLGGLYVQAFAREHPDEVTGMVLVDATHWAQLTRIRGESPGTYRTLKALSLLMSGIMRRELAGSEAEADLGAKPRASTPTIVLSSTVASPGETGAFRELARRLQLVVAAANATVRHEWVSGSGHYIQREAPERVVAAIRELAGCQAP